MECINELFRSSLLPSVVCGLLCVAAVWAFAMRSASVYAALSAVLGGVLLGGLLHRDADAKTVGAAIAFFAIFSGMVYLLFFCVFSLWRLRTERKKRRAEIAKRLQYTLPQRENTYVRDRLNVALNIPQAEDESRQLTVSLKYALELFGKAQNAPLSIGERLRMEEMGRILTLYKGKENWSASEVRGFNDMCAYLLKLSAKYAVESKTP